VAPDDGPRGSDSQTTGDQPGFTAPAVTHWGEFRIIRKLGEGAFGQVYRAFDEGLSKEIALKVVRPKDRSRLAEAMREGRMLARMHHPHIVTVHAVRHIGDEVGVVMELVEGESLEQRVKSAGRLGAEEAIAIGQTLCHALAAVHGAGLLHRDIKARNVMRESGGRIVLVDFGAGRDREPKEPTSDFAGTPAYLAPELYVGAPASPASDLYSVGVLLYFLVTGAYPVEGATPAAIAHAHSKGRRRSLVDRRPDLPHDFIRVVERALSKSPEGRYETAGDMLIALDALSVRSTPGLQPMPYPPPPRPNTTAMVWAGAALAVVAFLIFLGFLNMRVYQATFSLSRLPDASPGQWLLLGAHSLLAPSVLAAMALIAILIVRVAWQIIVPAVPPLRRLSDRLSSSVSMVLDRRMPRDTNTLARWILLSQAIALVVLFWVLQDVLSALVAPFEDAEPATWHVLHYTEERLSILSDYLICLPLAAVLMGYMWWRLLRRPGAIAVVDKTLLSAGVAIVALLILAVGLPWRAFHGTQEAPGYRINGERCYELERLQAEAIVFCPDAPKRQRTRTVPVSELQDDQKVEPAIFEPVR
jgi:serine/threonine protein kinase